MTEHIPRGAHSLGVYIIQRDSDAAIRWYVENLGDRGNDICGLNLNSTPSCDSPHVMAWTGSRSVSEGR